MSAYSQTNIGIVEDDARIREALRAIIATTEDLRVDQGWANTEDALANWTQHCPEVVIMDINLPGASGIDCVRGLASRWPSTQFLMYTMHDDDQRVFDALKAGANGYLLKSAKPQEILNAIRELLQGGSPMSAPIARRVVAHLRPAKAGGNLTEAGLTEREHEVLQLLAEGLLYKEISLRLGISESAIKQHIHRMYAKLHVQNRTEAVNRYFGR
ncbi:MAG: response regulator transcription factor [Flavobacteriales bacterium]|nr:response regulator transcription factor [Flavobacteriales bacterium]